MLVLSIGNQITSYVQKEVYSLLKNEFIATEGTGKLLLIALFFNIPIDAFIPYLSQVVTIITLSIFLKKYLVKNTGEATSANANTYGISKLTISLIVATMVYQLPIFWIPFVTQLVTLLLLGLIYATSTHYKK
jgi:hypothetical protein